MNIKDTIKLFAYDNIQEATLKLLDYLGITVQVLTKEPISLTSLFETPLESIVEINKKIYESYLVCSISNKTFIKSPSIESIDTVYADFGKYNQLLVFAVDIKEGVKLNRSDIITLTRALNRAAKTSPVLLVCRYYKNSRVKFSLSLCERTNYYQSGRTGEKVGIVNILRDIDPLQIHRGHIDIIDSLKLNKCNNFDSLYHLWINTFNISTLSSAFYKRLQAWFYWASDNIQISTSDVVTEKEMNQAFCIRLLSRLIICWFLKEKRDEKGASLITSSLLDVYNRETLELNIPLRNLKDESFLSSNSYYCGILYNVFNALNNEQGTDDWAFTDYLSENFDFSLFQKIPYINCETFRPFTVDSFTEKTENLSIPNKLFFGDDSHDGIIRIFQDYIFTTEESTPTEEDIALEPDLLGRVFENLLAEIDPRTKDSITASIRKATGAYYTPRPILLEMVNSSICQYLVNNLTEKDTSKVDIVSYIRSLVFNNIKLTTEYDSVVAKLLYKIKVLDPACGSGSFPVAYLQKLEQIAELVDPENVFLNDAISTEQIFYNLSKHSLILHSKNSEVEKNRYLRKIAILENAIYGCDIQPLAIQITKLRFFISLIVKQKLDSSLENRGFIPLPNLEAKFVCVDSLKTVSNINVEPSKRVFLKNIYSEIFHCENTTLLNNKIEDLSEYMSEILNETDSTMSSQNLKQWYKEANRPLDIFSPTLLCPTVEHGFDIVIGNPPFGAIISESDKILYKQIFNSTICESAIFFILLGLKILKNNGVLTYLSPKPLLYASNYKAIRNHIKDYLYMVADCGKAFSDVKFEQIVIGLIKDKEFESYCNLKYENKEFSKISSVKKSSVDQYNLFLNDVNEEEILIADKMNDTDIYLGQISSNTRGQGLQSLITKSGTYPVIGGKDIDMFGVRSVKGYISTEVKGNAQVQKESLLFQNIVAHIENPYPHVKLIGCIAPDETYYIIDTINQIVIDEPYNYKIIWALLNSKLISWYTFGFIYGKAIRTMHFDNVATARIPIKYPQDSTILSHEIEKLLMKRSQGEDTSNIEQKVNLLIYKLYGLSFKEILLIDPQLIITADDYDSIKNI